MTSTTRLIQSKKTNKNIFIMKRIISISVCVVLLILMGVSLSSCQSEADRRQIEIESILVELDNIKEGVENLEPANLESQKEELKSQIELLESDIEGY